MTYIIEPYYTWPGHFSQYCSALEDSATISLTNRTRWYLSGFQKNPVLFMLARIWNSLILCIVLFIRVKRGDIIHFVEFEPVSGLLFFYLIRNKSLRIIQTIHAIRITKTRNVLVNKCLEFQRQVFHKTCGLLSVLDTTFVFHSEMHREEFLDSFRGQRTIHKQTCVIEYPCPEIKKVVRQQTRRDTWKLLIFGQLREDKKIYEFLSLPEVQNIPITIAGKIYDPKLHTLKGNRAFSFIDRFLSEDEVTRLMESHDFLLLPYGKSYPGGAGPLKDAFSYGLPVLCSDIPLFREITEKYQLGKVFTSPKELIEIIRDVSETDWEEMSKRCYSYAALNSWTTLNTRYKQLYVT